ncbi:hypothetical protein RJ640_023185 [Escallonia rubra]|uniref:Reverse transcriptase Ty1/copia-type domain-containing protein n=1 Tax=Escallonia rubra TaxID=112253 RepID=A0AA88RQF6_9ASTE|nr:hypothetical protein RJ640_023185 [Escallonia rubra]
MYFLRRTLAMIYVLQSHVEKMGKVQDVSYEILNVLSTCGMRKRQSVICHYPDGRHVLYCKVELYENSHVDQNLNCFKCPYEHTLYVKTNKDGDIAIVCLYVDDLIFTSNNLKFLSEFREDMIAQFEMTDIGLMSYFLGTEVKQTNKGIFISQKKYARDILKKFKMEACNPILIPVEDKLKLVKDGSGDLINATNFRRLVGSLRKRNVELEEQMIGKKVVSEGEKGMEVEVDFTGEKDEADRVFELMVENKVLEYEKKKAESEVEVWKAKCKELESRLIESEEIPDSDGARPDSVGLVEPYTTTLQMPTLEIQGNKVASVSSGCALRGTLPKTDTASDNSLKRTLVELSDKEDMGGYKGSSPFTSTPKRKRASNIVNTDSESDDDNAPICKFKNKHLQDSNADACLSNCPVTAVSGDEVRKSTVSRRLLSTLRKVEIKHEPERCSPNVDEDDGPESEGESLGGFIVDSSDVSDSDVDELEDLSDDNSDFNDSARGYNYCDAFRGSMLAEFLTDGDPLGDLKKSVEELKQYNSKGVELCRTLATHYSKQLFEIYKNKEDPLFLPS